MHRSTDELVVAMRHVERSPGDLVSGTVAAGDRVEKV